MTDYIPPYLFRNRHIQSIIPSLKFRRPLLKMRAAGLVKNSREVILDAGDGVRLQGFYSPQKNGNGNLVIMIHGWEGSSDSLYLLSAAGELYKKGYNVFRLNMRDHGSSHHLNKELFNSCRLDEIVNAVKNIQQTYAGGGKTFLCGFSLGGNFSLRVAEKAPASGILLDHVIAVCPVLYPPSTLDAIDNGFLLYRKYFIRKWTKSLEIKKKLFPGDFDFSDKRIYKNLEIMTDYFVENYTEYADLSTYLDGYAITGDRLKELKIPSHIITSKDDPVIPFDDIRNIAKSDNLKILPVKYGGHCGFIKDYTFKSWVDDKIVEIFEKG